MTDAEKIEVAAFKFPEKRKDLAFIAGAQFGQALERENAAGLVEALKRHIGTCHNSGMYGPLGISPGGCAESKHACAVCLSKKALAKYESGESGK